MHDNILIIYASPRGEDSLSHQLATAFVERLTAKGFAGRIVARNLTQTLIPYVDQAWIKAAFTPEAERSAADITALALSDRLIAEVEAADLIIIATPMHNYGMPAPLKAWVDQVVRIGKTFSFDLARGDWPLEPILSGKNMLVLSSRGEFGFLDGARQSMNHLDPHLATVAHYLGVASKDIQTITVEYQEFKDERHEQSVAHAIQASKNAADQWLAHQSIKIEVD